MHKAVLISAIALLNLSSLTMAEPAPRTPPHVTSDDTRLPVQGRAVREFLWVDVYRIGLYFSDDIALRSLLVRPAEVAVRIEIITDQLPSEPPQEWAEVFRDHLSAPLSAALMQGFAQLRKGDTSGSCTTLPGIQIS